MALFSAYTQLHSALPYFSNTTLYNTLLYLSYTIFTPHNYTLLHFTLHILYIYKTKQNHALHIPYRTSQHFTAHMHNAPRYHTYTTSYITTLYICTTRQYSTSHILYLTQLHLTPPHLAYTVHNTTVLNYTYTSHYIYYTSLHSTLLCIYST
jgi:hypothetical protein